MKQIAKFQAILIIFIINFIHLTFFNRNKLQFYQLYFYLIFLKKIFFNKDILLFRVPANFLFNLMFALMFKIQLEELEL